MNREGQVVDKSAFGFGTLTGFKKPTHPSARVTARLQIKGRKTDVDELVTVSSMALQVIVQLTVEQKDEECIDLTDEQQDAVTRLRGFLPTHSSADSDVNPAWAQAVREAFFALHEVDSNCCGLVFGPGEQQDGLRHVECFIPSYIITRRGP